MITISRNEVQRFDSLFLSKLCHYFNCTIGDIMEYIPPEDDNN